MKCEKLANESCSVSPPTGMVTLTHSLRRIDLPYTDDSMRTFWSFCPPACWLIFCKRLWKYCKWRLLVSFCIADMFISVNLGR